MKINKAYKIRMIADKPVIILQGKHGVDTTKVMSLNTTAYWLWKRFENEDDFSEKDVIQALIDEYGISLKIASHDAKEWISTMIIHNTIIESVEI